MDIQSLIDDIDGILLIAASRPLWFKPGDPARERQVLERVRSYLSQQQNLVSRPTSATNNASSDGVQQIVQAVRQEMSVLRADLLQPLQADLKVLHQQRESLVQEIRQMERSKHELDLSVQPKSEQQFISEFSQELISRCTASLTQQFGHILEGLETRWSGLIVATEATNPGSTKESKGVSAIAPQERLEQLRQLQAESDHLLSTLDVNQRVIFETLQSDLQSYQESLSQGLEKMHNLGAQGETLFTALINRLAQQLGAEASTLLRSSLQASDTTTKSNLPSQVEPASLPSEALKLTRQDASKTGLALSSEPYLSTRAATPTGTSPSSEQAKSEDIFADNLNSEDWEIIEGLDSDSSEVEESDRIDTFIQIDLETSNPSAPQDLDYLLGLKDEPSTPLTPLSRQGELIGVEALNQAAELNIISDLRRQEIDDLYKSLFGGDSLISPSTPENLDDAEESSATSAADAEILPQISSVSQIFTEAVNLKEVEGLLFEGLVDPAIQSTQGQAEDWSARQPFESWDLFVENAAADLPEETKAETPAPHETLTTIGALTDLFEEMGISEPIAVKTDIPATSTQPDAPTLDSKAETAHLVEDQYIPASPEEDLLVTDTLDGDPDREIRLDQKALRQLSDDLYSFEDGTSRSFSSLDAPTSAAGADRSLMSDELLAEDWEEFVFPIWPNDDLTSNLTETSQAPAEASIPTSLSEELDFEPDLFPSETLELDHESLDGQMPEEYIGFEDEIVIDEMEWDEPIDGIMEEAIASPLEFGEAAKQNALLLGQDQITDEIIEEAIASPLEFGEAAKQNALLLGQEDASSDSTIVNLPVTESESLNAATTTQNLAQTAENTASNLDPETTSTPTNTGDTSSKDASASPESSIPSAQNTSDLDLAQPDGINSQTGNETLPHPVETKNTDDQIPS